MGTLLNPNIIKSGEKVIFDNTAMDNYYSFTMSSAGNVLINGTENNGTSAYFKIYDSNFKVVTTTYNDSNESSLISLSTAGTYYIQAESDLDGGYFFLTSNKISGTIISTPIKSGEKVIFDNTAMDNYYSFTMSSAGNVLINGTENNGTSAYFKIYDSNFKVVTTTYNDSNESSLISLSTAGTYYIQAESDLDGGYFFLTSNKISGTIISTPIKSGEKVIFDNTAMDNYYSFTMSSAGNVLINGTENNGTSAYFKIYDSNFKVVTTTYNDSNESSLISLSTAGTYYIQAESDLDGGYFFLTSNKISGTIISTPIKSGEKVIFDNTAMDNYYSFTMSSAGNVLINGTENNGTSAYFKIYDSNFKVVTTTYNDSNESSLISLSTAGTYYIQAESDLDGGYFFLTSNKISGTIISTPIKSGEKVIFDNTAMDNYYSFTMSSAGNVLINGTENNGTSAYFKIYDSNFKVVTTTYNDSNESSLISLSTAGTYYIQAESDLDGGYFFLTSNKISGTIISTPIKSGEKVIFDNTAMDNYYSFTMSSAGNVLINGTENNGTSAYFKIYDSNFKVVTTTYNDSNESSLISLSTAGTYYIQAESDLDGGYFFLTSSKIIDKQLSNTYNVSKISDEVFEIANGGIDTVNSLISYTLTSYVENLTLTGTTAINGTGNTLNNIITGNSANNVLDGKAGIDILKGGLGNDTYIVDNVKDVVTELASQGTDLVKSSVTYTLSANVENLTLTGTTAINGTGNTLNNTLIGNSGSNTLSGLAGNDVLNGGTGADTMLGGAGNDIYYVDNIGDKVYETTTVSATTTDAGGIDTVNSSISYTLTSFVENLTLLGTVAINGTGNTLNNTITGNASNNILKGGAGNDTLIGALGNDTLYGEVGNDILNGGLGNDILYGGTGLDKFVFNTAINSTTNKDIIKDFSVIDDTIVLENLIFTKLSTVGTLNTVNFVSNTTGKAVDANDYLVYNKGTGQLFYDADGSGLGASVQIAFVENKALLTYSDFTVI